MSLLIGIGLAIFILCYKAVDKQERKKIREAHEEKMNKAIEGQKVFHEAYGATIEETKEAEREAFNKTQLYEEVRQSLVEEAEIDDPTNYMVSRGILARQGKISYDASRGGFTTVPTSRADLENGHRFLIWLNNELINHGIPYELLYLPEGRNNKDAKPISVDDKLSCGRYYWEPLWFYNQITHEIVIARKYK